MPALRYPEKSHPGELNGNYKDGRSSHPLYGIWRQIIARTTDPGHPDWENYGGRGITVCAEWLDWQTFLRDVGERPEGTYPSGRARWELDRINNDGNYEPGNVRWATRSEQLLNRRERSLVECPHGHEYTPENTYINSAGFTECLTCKRIRGREWMRKKRAMNGS